jgi:LysM repeat protein
MTKRARPVARDGAAERHDGPITNHMNDIFDDDSAFWDEPRFDPERTTQIARVRRRTPERTRTHHVVERDPTAPRPAVADDGEELMWLEPVSRFSERLGPLSSVDPRLLSVGALALAAVLAVPLFGALSGNGGGDELRSVNEQTTTTVTTVPQPSTTAAVVVTAPTVEDESGDDAGDQSDSGSASDSSSSGGGGAARPQLRAAPDCDNRYTATAGDYWLLIAERIGTSLDDLLAVNQAAAETPIYPGSQICLPAGAATPSVSSGSSGSTASSGESGTSSTAGSVASCGNKYASVAGDYWLRIANAVDVSLNALLDLNDATAETPLYPGSEVCLPPGAAAPALPTSTAATTAPATTTPATTQSTNPQTTQTTAPQTTEPQTTQTPEPQTTAPATTDPPPAPPAPGEIEQMIRDVWPDDLEEQALRVAWRESSYAPTARNHCCHGLFQIHWEAHNSWLADHGVNEVSDLYDARTNVEMAYILYQRSGSWDPWAQTAY